MPFDNNVNYPYMKEEEELLRQKQMDVDVKGEDLINLFFVSPTAQVTNKSALQVLKSL